MTVWLLILPMKLIRFEMLFWNSWSLLSSYIFLITKRIRTLVSRSQQPAKFIIMRSLSLLLANVERKLLRKAINYWVFVIMANRSSCKEITCALRHPIGRFFDKSNVPLNAEHSRQRRGTDLRTGADLIARPEPNRTDPTRPRFHDPNSYKLYNL